MQFPHEKLSVYHKALGFFGNIQRSLSSWSNQHAFVDHLGRAAESMLFQSCRGGARSAAEEEDLDLRLRGWLDLGVRCLSGHRRIERVDQLKGAKLLPPGRRVSGRRGLRGQIPGRRGLRGHAGVSGVKSPHSTFW